MLNAFDMNVELPRTPPSRLFVDYGFILLFYESILFIEVFAHAAADGDCTDSRKFCDVL